MKTNNSKSLLAIIIILVVVTVVVLKFGLPYFNQKKQTAQNTVTISKVQKQKTHSSQQIEDTSKTQMSSSQSQETSSSHVSSTLEAFNQKQDQTGVDVTALTTKQCILWAVSERFSYQNADEQNWDEVRAALDSARIIPYNKNSDGFVHVQFKYGSTDCNYYIDGNHDLCNESGSVVSRFPTEFVNQKANDYLND